MTAITVQIPYEMVVPNPLLLIPIAQGFTTVTTSENGIASTSFLVQPVYDHVHILRTGDIGSQAEGDGYWALVTHADGTLVLQDIRSANGQPQNQTEAKPGEEVVMYAYGLGAVSPPVTGGALSPMPAAVAAESLYLRFDYSPDAGAAMPEVGGPPIMNTKPVFAGLTPGQVGLYQVNFVIPPPPPGTQPCGTLGQTNLTVSLLAAGSNSFDGVGICVDPGPPNAR